jgi:purine-binding chemotaxis protein CheW
MRFDMTGVMSLGNVNSRRESSKSTQTMQFLTFQSNGEIFAININCVKEIIEYDGVTLIPLMPAFVKGVLNLRGRVLPVIDLAVRLNRTTTTISRRNCVVVVEVNVNDQLNELGLLVDNVSAVLDLAANDIEPSPAFGSTIRPDFVEGMIPIDNHFVPALLIDKVLSIEEMSVLIDATMQGNIEQDAQTGDSS